MAATQAQFDAMAYGVIGKAVKEAMPHTEADPVGVMAQVLSMYSAAINGAVVPPNERPITVWTVLVGPSTVGRKGFAYDTAERILTDTLEDFMSAKQRGGVTSGAALINTLFESFNDDLATEASDDGGRVFIVDAEWPDTLQAQARDPRYATAFRNAWDGKRVVNTTKGKDGKRVEESVISPRLGYTAHIQPGLWHKYISSTAALGGTYNRLLPLSVRYSKVLDDDDPLPKLNPSAALVSAFKWARAERRKLTYAPAALKYKNALKREYLEILDQMPEELSCYVERSVEQIIRVASVLTAANKSTTITLAAMKAARAFVEYSIQSVKEVVAGKPQPMHRRNVPIDEKIRDILHRNDGEARMSVVLRSLQKYPTSEIQEAIEAAPDLKMERMQSTRPGAKPVVVSFVYDDQEGSEEAPQRAADFVPAPRSRGVSEGPAKVPSKRTKRVSMQGA